MYGHRSVVHHISITSNKLIDLYSHGYFEPSSKRRRIAGMKGK